MSRAYGRVVGVIGLGVMGGIISETLARSGYRVVGSDRHKRRIKNVMIMGSNRALAERSDVILLAIGHRDLDEVGNEIRAAVKGKLVVSLLAGTKLERINSVLPFSRNSRIMTSIAFRLGSAVSAYCLDKRCTKEDGNTVSALLDAGSEQTFRIKESQFNYFTARASCMLAFAAHNMEGYYAPIDKGDFDERTRKLMTLLSFKSAIELGLQGEDVAERVATKGGMTEQGLATLQRAKVHAAMARTLKNAKEFGVVRERSAKQK